jgi:8-oxo-dGTP pyrophosphatase MutT (NUDIX family)
MNLQQTIEEIEKYETIFEDEAEFQIQIKDFLMKNPEFYQRTTLSGHATGSAWIVSPDFKRALLIHHKKLNKWIQPGGHADDTDKTLLVTAAREASEECGIRVKSLSKGIFDLDVHTIPAKDDVPAHLHYDFRYIFVADPNAPKNINAAEVNAAQWVDLEHIMQKNIEQSIRRMILKTITM